MLLVNIVNLKYLAEVDKLVNQTELGGKVEQLMRPSLVKQVTKT